MQPRIEIHAPDLYIPLMSLMTFVLMNSLFLGIGDKFKPEIIGETLSKCLILLTLELAISKLSRKNKKFCSRFK